MKIVKLPLDSVKPFEKNPRIISDYQFAALKKSIKEFGFNAPILVNKANNTIISGHQRYKALKELGEEEGHFLFIELSEKEEVIQNIAMNRLGGISLPSSEIDIMLEIEDPELLAATGATEDDLRAVDEILKRSFKEDFTEPQLLKKGPAAAAGPETAGPETNKANLTKDEKQAFEDQAVATDGEIESIFSDIGLDAEDNGSDWKVDVEITPFTIIYNDAEQFEEDAKILQDFREKNNSEDTTSSIIAILQDFTKKL